MPVQVQRWGNHLTLSISKPFAEDVGVESEDTFLNSGAGGSGNQSGAPRNSWRAVRRFSLRGVCRGRGRPSPALRA